LNTDPEGRPVAAADALQLSFIADPQQANGSGNSNGGSGYQARKCPDCNGTLHYLEGCVMCVSCGWNKSAGASALAGAQIRLIPNATFQRISKSALCLASAAGDAQPVFGLRPGAPEINPGARTLKGIPLYLGAGVDAEGRQIVLQEILRLVIPNDH